MKVENKNSEQYIRFLNRIHNIEEIATVERFFEDNRYGLRMHFKNKSEFKHMYCSESGRDDAFQEIENLLDKRGGVLVLK